MWLIVCEPFRGNRLKLRAAVDHFRAWIKACQRNSLQRNQKISSFQQVGTRQREVLLTLDSAAAWH
jgi:hypothetical protein